MKLLNEEFIFIQLFINSQKLIIMEFKKTKNSQRIILSLKTRTPVHLKFLLIFTLLITTFSYSLNAQNWELLIDRDASKYDATTIIPDGCNDTDVNQSNYSNYTITLPPQSNTETYNFTLPLYGSLSAADITVTVPESSCSCTSITTSGITVSFENPNIPPFGPEFITFTIKALRKDGSLNWDEQKYQFKIKRKDIKLILVLDQSGSMALNVYGTSDSRWVTLQNAVASFLNKLEDDSQLNDSLGLTYFSTDVSDQTTIPPAIISNDVFGFWNTISGNTISASTLVVTDMNAHGPTNMTAVGKGLLNAKTKVNSETDISKTKRVILLFTDGLQNTPPLVNDNGQPVLTTPTETLLNDLTYPIGTCDDNSIRYYVVTTLATGDDVDYLVNLANDNCGFYQSVFLDDGLVDLTDLYDNNFQTMLYGNSPQIVSSQTGQLTNGKAEFEFKINDYLSNILFELNFKTGDQFRITSIEKDGKILTGFFKNKDIPSANFLMRTLDLPVKYEKDLLSSKGLWKVTVEGQSQNPFKIKCFVNDHLFNYYCTSDKSSYTVGDTVLFKTRLLIGNDTLSGTTSKVKILLLKPGDDIGNLLATYATPDAHTDTADIATPAEQKFIDLLYNDSTFLNALTANENVIELTAGEDGIFTGVYTNTNLTGVYHALFMIDAEDSNMGDLVRTKLLSLRFKFGLLDPNETTVNIDVNQGDKWKNAVITIRPKNKFGYYMGPGFMNKINLKINAKQGIIKDKIDNLDGSYTFKIENIPDDVNPADFPVIVYGEQIIPSETCYPVTVWYYIILILLILIIILIRKLKGKFFKILMWLLLTVWVIYIILRYLDLICYKFL